MTSFELKKILEEYQLTEGALIDCIYEIRKINKRINKIYDEAGGNWKKLNIYTIRRILETYNKSIINVKTGEITATKEDLIIEDSSKKTFKVITTLEYNGNFPGGTTDIDIFALTKKENRQFHVIYYNNQKEPGIELVDWRNFTPTKELGIEFDDIISVNFDSLEKNVNQILFCVYLYNEKKPKDAFSQMMFSLLDNNDNIICSINVTDEMNNAIGVTGFEFIKEKEKWKVNILAEPLSYDINKLICTL